MPTAIDALSTAEPYESLGIKQQPADVIVVNLTALTGWLRSRPVVLEDSTVEAVFEAARRWTTWRPQH